MEDGAELFAEGLAAGGLAALATADDGPKSWGSRLKPHNVKESLRQRARDQDDPREAYRASSRPEDPAHENMLALRPDTVGAVPLVPVFEGTRGRPTPPEIRGYVCRGACIGCLLCVGTVASLVGYVVYLAVRGETTPGASSVGPVHCGARSAGLNVTSVSHVCVDAATSLVDPRPLLLPGCNRCETAWDGVCDEATVADLGASSDCQKGTDGFDCAVATREVSALVAACTAQSVGGDPTSQEGWKWLSNAVYGLCILASLVFAPVSSGCFCCGDRCYKGCQGCVLHAVPVVSDMLFEIIRSRGLAIVEGVAFFLLWVALALGWRQCNSTFVITPISIPIDEDSADSGDTYRDWALLWPAGMPKMQASLRPDDASATELLTFLFLMRFICCNLANSQWQSLGRNFTGVAFVFALIFSVWSLALTSNDAMYCRYPTRDGYHDSIEGGSGTSSTGYCTIYSQDGRSWPSNSFMQDCTLQNSSGWNASLVSYRQLFDERPIPELAVASTSGPLIFAPARAQTVVLLDDHANKFRATAEKLSTKLSIDAGDQPHMFESQSAGGSEQDSGESFADRGQCSFTPGSMLDAIAGYSAECESNNRMRESAILVSCFALLNWIELALLFKIGVRSGCFAPTESCKKQLKDARDSRSKSWLGDYVAKSHADYTSANPAAFFFPVRLVVAVTVGWTVVIMLAASLDQFALHIEFQLDLAEQGYRDVVVPFMRDGVGEMLGGYPYHNVYFDLDEANLPPRNLNPSFNAPDADCPCNVLGQDWKLVEELWPHVSAIASASGALRRRRLQQAGDVNLQEHCPSNAHFDAVAGQCLCDEGYEVDSDGTSCIDGDALQYHIRETVAIMERPETGRLVKCSFEMFRVWYEPLPFAMRYGYIMSMVVGAVSTMLYMYHFRHKAMKVAVLVEKHFDPVNGWPKDPTVLQEDDVRLLTGGRRSWKLDYNYMNKLPSFIGLYCGNFVMSFLVSRQPHLWLPLPCFFCATANSY